MLNKYELRQLILEAYLNSEIDKDTAIERIKVSCRQFSRILSRYKKEGFNGLVHKLSGQPSNHRLNDALRQSAISAYKSRYNGFNYVHASEKLEEHEQVQIHPSTLRNWLLSENITKPKHKRKKYHKCREPRARFGELVQLDGSIHDWFGDGINRCLMHFVDDATSISFAILCDGENVESALTLLYEWCCRYGVPQAIYSDHDSVYKINPRLETAYLTIEEQLAGQKEALTKFGKICDRLGIEQIFANSPQAKGKVERKHFVYQDRLVKEIQLYGLKTLEEVNEFLLKPNGFIDKINKKFSVIARDEDNACIKVPQSKLYAAFTIDEVRIVRNDYTVQFKNKVYQLTNDRFIYPKTKITIKTYLDGNIAMFANQKEVNYVALDNYKRPVVTDNKKDSSLQQQTLEHKIKKISPWHNYKPKAKATKSVANKKNLESLAIYYS